MEDKVKPLIDVNISSSANIPAQHVEVTVTLRGAPEEVVKVLIRGLPMDVLEAVQDAFSRAVGK